jgi:hypothetical protein
MEASGTFSIRTSFAGGVVGAALFLPSIDPARRSCDEHTGGDDDDDAGHADRLARLAFGDARSEAIGTSRLTGLTPVRSPWKQTARKRRALPSPRLLRAERLRSG